MKTQKSKPDSVKIIIPKHRNGSSLVLVAMSLVILSFLGIGMLKVAWGVRHNAIKTKNETISMLAAEAGYEKAIFWMSQRQDMLSAIQQDDAGVTDGLKLPSGEANYQIMLYTFAGSRPVYRVISNGSCGQFTRTVDVLVIQAISGWDMGRCMVPTGTSSTSPVYFVDGEIIDMPLHINDQQDSPDHIDIHLDGDPQFLQTAGMGESRYTKLGGDKYGSEINKFDNGILFNQPDNRITDKTTVQNKIERFKDSTNPQYKLSPVALASGPISNPEPAVQLEFFVEDGVGKVRVTNDCTVQSHEGNTYDYKVKDGSDGKLFEKYDIYSYHYAPKDKGVVYNVEDTYVSQDFGGVESEPGGQIYIDGNVVIGGDLDYNGGNQLVKGKITVVATGNIWVADSITVDGAHDADGKPSQDNPNILGLVADGVVKVVDPGMSEQVEVDFGSSDDINVGGADFEYAPIGLQDETVVGGRKWVQTGYFPWQGYYVDVPAEVKESNRLLPQEMIVEAALTVGGGGWGAENVYYYNGRKNTNSSGNDDLILRGTITEVIRGVVGHGSNGYLKNYYFDSRVLEGILPGDMWLQGKFVPAPAGWHDYRSAVDS